MQEILVKASGYVAIMILGFLLRRIGFFDEHTFPVLSRLVLRVTLPGAVIVNAASREIDPGMLVIVLLGFGGGLLYMVVGWLLERRKGGDAAAFSLLNLSGYNIGTFALPFTQSFLGSVGVLTTSLFDVGNAFVCLGGAYGVAAAVQDGRGMDVKGILKALATSVPFLAYAITLAMNLLHIPIPGFVVSWAGVAANANVFLAMLMLGVGFRLDLDFSKLGKILKILLLRYGIATVLALGFYFLLPLPLEARQALAILAFAPVASAVPGFTEQLKGDVELSCTINSLSIVVSILIIVVLLMVML